MRDGVTSTADLVRSGVSRYTIDTRCRPGGPWLRLLPGVILLTPGSPTRLQQVRAAALYTGPESVITGVDALHAHGLPALPLPPRVHVLQRPNQRLNGHDFLLLERTTRRPPTTTRSDLHLATPARATLDAARREQHPLRLHQLLAAVLRAGLATATELLDELDAGSKRGAAAPRAALRQLTGG
ncbi:hypothetical protein [Umezawaea tangerina]|uniref:Transcriptional regulator with AbiEi antitoxin domain of type IV toxin-antitoxin system n=1 Tax=Umezawaea tangerina TaxID=84725 RepID=A0A2T0S6U0_9PSEU|nr:hypothetical protein [Umezawaea tangerina]PRY29149.1 hypothetical protein CLV43_12622 [Umezawaea tangerina]